jgi:peroxiredoxin/predicted 2-oxoglutarate/Fe(II)-dependent dioxygenase YbiX
VLTPGDPAPHFVQRSTANPRYAFHSAAGRYLVLCFFVSLRDPASQKALQVALANRKVFNDEHASFFGVSADTADEPNLKNDLPGFRFFFDYDAQISSLYGSLPADAKAGEKDMPMRRLWVVMDPTMRILALIPFSGDDGNAPKVVEYVKNLPPPRLFAGIPLQAPILYLPNVFEPALCRDLIKTYETQGNEESGFMREENGRTVLAHDYNHKRRRDHVLSDEKLIEATRQRVRRRIAPEIMKIHQFNATRMERYLVACYRAEDNAHFQPHRDNTTRGTAHRRFAVSINLNDDFEGGEISFPEYGPQSFKPAIGAAVVFSCSMLHAVSNVKRGNRFAFLPFLYDEAAAKLREENLKFLDLPGAQQQAAASAPAAPEMVSSKIV